MRALITGIGGSIGCHVMCHLFHNTDWDLVGIDSFRHKGLTDRVEECLKDHPDWRPRLTLYPHDLTAPISKLLENKLGKIDYIFNLAALSDVHDSIANPEPFVLNNTQVILTMLEYARKAQPKAFVQISTDEVYGPVGITGEHPEWSPIVPSNPYSASKAAQECIAIAYWRSYGVPLIIVNTMNNFGEMQQANKFPALVQKKVSNDEVVVIHGNQETVGSRHYLHSRNFADALLFITQRGAPRQHQEGEIDRPDRYNVVGDRRIDNLALAQMIAFILSKELKYEFADFKTVRPGHDRHYGLDGKKLADLGWVAPNSLEKSLRDTIEWTQAHAEWLDT